jgi:hypothetical protein
MRADRRRNVLAAARILGWTSRDGTTRPTRSRTAARMGVTERTVSKLWRELERLGYLACVEQGTTAQYRPSWAREEGNLARCWRLVLPESSPRPEVKTSCCKEDPRAGFPQAKKLTDEGGRRESARFLRAGWLPRDVAYAAEHTPEGVPWAMNDPVRHPRAWLRWRLSRWLGPDGAPLLSRSQRQAAAHVAVLAEAERRRAGRKVGTAPPQAWHDARKALRLW